MCILYVETSVFYLQYSEKVFVCAFFVLFLCCFGLLLSAFLCMLCIFMTYSTSYRCHYKLMDPLYVRMYVCMKYIRNWMV